MKLSIKKMALALGAAILASSALADEVSVKKALFEKFKNLPPVINVKKTDVSGIYEVNMFGRPAYTNEKVDYLLLNGSLINLANLEDLTSKRRDFLLPEFVAALPIEHAIKTVYGKGERVFYTFEDPDCPYCRQFTREMHRNADKVNATVYTFMFPLTIHKDAPRKAAAILCSADKSATWKSWMLEDKGLPLQKGTETSDNPILDAGAKIDCPAAKGVAVSEKIARTLGFNSTPRVLLATGRDERGVKSMDDLNSLLTESAAALARLKDAGKPAGDGKSESKPAAKK